MAQIGARHMRCTLFQTLSTCLFGQVIASLVPVRSGTGEQTVVFGTRHRLGTDDTATLRSWLEREP